MKKILGIDPGTLVMGYGVLEIHDGRLSMSEMGVLQLSKYKDHSKRLHYIFERVSALVQIHEPILVAIEAPFFGKNVQSMLKLGRAQGVAIAAAMAHGSPVEEFSPKKIKQSITGNGNASKEQVWMMLQNILKFQDNPQFLDATDALAAALCAHYQMSSPIPVTSSLAPKKKKNSWSDFIAQNPEIVKNTNTSSSK